MGLGFRVQGLGFRERVKQVTLRFIVVAVEGSRIGLPSYLRGLV